MNRRQILGAIACTPALAVACAPQPAVAQASTFSRLLAEYRRAQAVEEHHWQTVYEPAMRAYDAARDAVQHLTFNCGNKAAKLNIGCTLSTDSDADICAARYRIGLRAERGGEIDSVNLPSMKADNALIAAHEARMKEHRRIAETTGYRQIEDEGERLSDETYRLGWAVLDCPASTLTDLSAKADLVTETERWGNDRVVAAIVADIRRLAGEA